VAVEEWLPLAEQGDVVAQYYLGTMYADGDGIPQDQAEATKWFRLAEKSLRARADEPEAQWALGTMYQAGWGVPQDYVLARMWFNLAAAQEYEFAREDRDEVEKFMTPEQIAEAERLTQEWQSNARKTTARNNRNFVIALGVLLFIFAFLAFFIWALINGMKCPACGQRRALKTTGAVQNQGFWRAPLREYRCKHCGHQKWIYDIPSGS
jgi:DNA-directed RNA polymerase subunit RPC12/RpoP